MLRCGTNPNHFAALPIGDSRLRSCDPAAMRFGSETVTQILRKGFKVMFELFRPQRLRPILLVVAAQLACQRLSASV